MALLSPQKVSQAGLEPTFDAAGVAGDEFAGAGNRVLVVRNGGAAPINVTISGAQECNQGSLHDLVVEVTNGEDGFINGVGGERFLDPDGHVQVSYSDVASVTVAVLEV